MKRNNIRPDLILINEAIFSNLIKCILFMVLEIFLEFHRNQIINNKKIKITIDFPRGLGIDPHFSIFF
jgi:hypothetical protein